MNHDPNDRFVIMKHPRPFHYLITISHDGSPPTTAPMDWQVVDKGVSSDVDWKLLASFANEEEALALRDFLVHMATEVQTLRNKLDSWTKPSDPNNDF